MDDIMRLIKHTSNKQTNYFNNFKSAVTQEGLKRVQQQKDKLIQNNFDLKESKLHLKVNKIKHYGGLDVRDMNVSRSVLEFND